VLMSSSNAGYNVVRNRRPGSADSIGSTETNDGHESMIILTIGVDLE
jgi:hypothetical protein